MIIDDIIEVVAAYNAGKKIEFREKVPYDRLSATSFNRWNEAKTPQWNFVNFEYRIKVEYEPYKSAEEFLKAQSGQYNKYLVANSHLDTDILYSAYVNSDNHVFVRKVGRSLTKGINDERTIDFATLLRDFSWADFERTPCGNEIKTNNKQ